jgi:hypothetical protein
MWVLRFVFLIGQLFNSNLSTCLAIFCNGPPLWSTNPMSHVAPSRGFNSEPRKGSTTIDRATGEFCHFFNLSNYLVWNVALTCLLLQRPSSTKYKHHTTRRSLLWLQPNTKIKQRDTWPCTWWVLWIFIFLPLFQTELTRHLLPPPSYMNHKPQAAPSRGLNLKPIKISRANDHINGEFCDFFLFCQLFYWEGPTLTCYLLPLLSSMN